MKPRAKDEVWYMTCKRQRVRDEAHKDAKWGRRIIGIKVDKLVQKGVQLVLYWLHETRSCGWP